MKLLENNILIFGIPYLKKGSIIKCQKGTTEEGLTKEDSVRLLKLKPRFVGNRSDEYFWKAFKFEKDTSDVADFFKSYLSSKGFERILNNQDNWWKSRHPYRKWYSNSDLGTRKWFDLAKRINPNLYIADMFADLSASYVLPDEHQRTNIVGTWKTKAFRDGYEYNPIEARGHEYAHGIAPFNIFGAALFNSKSAQAEALDLNTNTRPGHDSRREEKHADLWGLRYLLYKEGIYDSRDDKDITEEEILKLREKYPDLRPLRLMDNKLIMFQLNNVAYSDSDIVRAKSGIKIKKKNRGKFTEYCGGEVTNECILKAKKSNNPKLRKRATFAANARKWKHEEGGSVHKPFGHRSILDNGWIPVEYTKKVKKKENGGLITKFKNPAEPLRPSRNWDKTLTGQLINFSENPDSIGWDAKNRRWYAPPAGKGYDTNLFGMGVDRNQTLGFKERVKKDNKGREYLTEYDERYLRHLAIDRANESANTRYKYALKATKIKGAVSPKHDAITVSAIYNLGPGHVARTLFENKSTMKALFNRNSSAYQNAVHQQYKNKNRNTRISNELKFFKSK